MIDESEFEGWELQSDEPTAPLEWLGVDVGFVFPACDSDGHVYRWATSKDRRRPKDFTRAGPVTVKSLDGSVIEREAYRPDQFADVMSRARDDDYRSRVRALAQRIVTKATESGRGIVLEDWEDFKARRSAWVDLYRRIRKLAIERGVPVRTVNRAYTSQTCPACGHVSRSNRKTRNQFRCTACKFSGQADVVAAKNLQAAHTSPMSDNPATCRNTVCDKPVWRVGVCCSCYFHRRRYGELPTKQRLEALRAAKNLREFKKTLEEVSALPLYQRPERPPWPRFGATEQRLTERSRAALRASLDALDT